MSSVDDKLKRVTKVMQLKLQYPKFVEITATAIANKEILDYIHEEMAAKNYSKKIIERTYLEKVQLNNEGFLTFVVVSDYESESRFDVAKGREEGTDRVFVRPVYKKALHWIQVGFSRFSLGHWRRGIQASHIIDRVVAQRLSIAQDRLDRETDELIDKILKS